MGSLHRFVARKKRFGLSLMIQGGAPADGGESLWNRLDLRCLFWLVGHFQDKEARHKSEQAEDKYDAYKHRRNVSRCLHFHAGLASLALVRR